MLVSKTIPADRNAADLQIHDLEPRILLSATWVEADLLVADALADIGDDVTDADLENALMDDAYDLFGDQSNFFSSLAALDTGLIQQSDAANSNEVVFIDSGVQDPESLLAGINSKNVFWLSSDTDGVQQISAVLAEMDDVDAVHIISHGESGRIQLGANWLDASTVDANAEEIVTWGDALTEDGDILFYGCDFGDTENGESLVDQLALLTGADIAASNDLTGAADLGGNWELEVSIGEVDTEILFSLEVQATYAYTLGSPEMLPVDPAFHFDATDIDASGSVHDEPVDGSSVTTWNDTSANDLHFGTTSTNNEPTVENDKKDSINNQQAIEFDGDDILTRTSDVAINSNNFAEKSFAIAFETGKDVKTTQVLYEQGGGTRGYNFVIEDGHLYAQVYNRSEWAAAHQYKVIDLGSIKKDTTYSLTAVHDATGATLADRTWSAYLYDADGLVDSGQLNNVDMQYSHGAIPAIGSASNDSLHPITQGYLVQTDGFRGKIGELISWNDALDKTEISDVQEYMHSKWFFGANDDLYHVTETGTFTVDGLLTNDAWMKGKAKIVEIDGDSSLVGSTIILSSGAVIEVNDDGTFTYDTNDSFAHLSSGEIFIDSFEYTIKAGKETDTATVEIEVFGENEPVDGVADFYETSEDGGFTLISPGVLANDIDADEDDVLFVSSYDDSATIGLVSMATNDSQIGETGRAIVDSGGTTITLSRTYNNPVVFAFITTQNEGDATVVRIDNIGGNRFDLTLVEPNSGGAFDDSDGIHGNESVSFIVLEEGEWVLDDGTLLEVGTLSTDVVAGSFESNVSFDTSFDYPPALFTQTQTNNNDLDFLKTRQRNTLAGSFDVALERYESVSSSFVQAETVGYLAIESGSGNWNGMLFEAGLTSDSVTHSAQGIAFGQDLGSDVNLIGNIATFDGGDDAYLRGVNLTGNGIDVHVEEDRTREAETAHTTERASYLAIGGSGALTGNSSSGPLDTGGFTYDPDGKFDHLAEGETATDQFTYVVKDGMGSSDEVTVTITINGVNDEPVAVDGTHHAIEDGGTVHGMLAATDVDLTDNLVFSLVTGPTEGSVTVDADGAYHFDPGTGFQDLAEGEDRDIAFTYRVTDGNGGESTATVTITVSGENDSPVANTGTNSASEDGAPVSGTLDASDLDTSDDLTFSLVTAPSEGSVSVNADGSYEFDPGADFQDLAVDESRDVAFEYKVVDGHGGESTAVVTITVSGTNDGPVASTGTNDASEDGTPVSGTLDASDLDTSDDLTFSLVTGPSEGSVSVNADGSYEFDPGADFQDLAVDESRDVTFEYKVVDGHSGESTAVVTITVSGTNDGPVASAGTNDASEDGATVSGTLDASDLDTSDDLTFSLVTAPSEGSVSVNADGSYEFDPGADFQDLAVDESRDVTFEYKVVDGHGGESNAVVTITVSGTNDGPVASAGTNDASEDGTPVSGTLDASDLDTSDDLTFSLVTAPSEGSVSVNADGSYEFDPGADFQDLAVDESRDVTFEYKVVDGHGGESNAVVTITVSGTNDGPVASTGTNDASEDGAPVSGTLDASDLDTSDDLTFSLVTGPSEGSVSVNADGSYEFDPGADFQDLAVDESRDVTFEYKVVDGHSGESTAVVTITVSGTNDGPVASAGTNDASEDGAPVSGTLDASDLDTSDDLTFSLVTGPSEGSVSVNADGSYEFDPGADFQDLAVDESRDVTFEYKVVDGHGGESNAVVTITVSGTNDGPVASAGTNDASEDGAPVSGTLDASDLDTSDDLTFSLVTGPSEGSVSVNADGSYEFDPGADFQDLAVDESRDVSFEYKVVDGHSGESTAVVTITVSGTNDGPVASAGTNDASEDGAPVSGTLDASDLDTSDDLTFSLVTAPSEGSVSVNADGSYEFDPGADFQDLAVDESRDVTFEYKVVDGHGGESNAVVTITVSGTNDGPVASAGTNDASEDGAPVSGTLDASDLDTSDDLTFSLVTAPSEGSVSVNADGSYEFDPGADFQDLAVDESRDVAFEYKVVDGHGGESNAVVTITVSGTNDGPVASTGTNDASEDGTPVSGTLDASDLDTSDDLTFSLVTGPSEGSVSVNADGSYEFDPGADFQDLAVDESRDVTFEYKVVDGHGGESNAVVTITVSGTNDGPVATAGTNDASEDGAPVSGTLDASDLDTSDDLTFSLVTGPSEGSVSVNADGSYEFDPGADFQDLAVDESRDVSFEYKVVDGHGGESTAVVTITVSGTNDGPVASAGTNDASEDGAPVSGTLDASDLDTSDDLTFSLVTGPSEGSVSVNADGSYEFDPGADFQDLAVDESRDVAFEYKVVDGHGGESNAVVTITVSGTNDGPVASAGTNDASEDGAPVSGTLDASDLDTSDDLTFSLVTAPSEGSVSVNADGSYEFDPGADFQDLAVDESRDVTFEYKVVDGHGGESTAVVTITVSGTNDGPVATAGTNDASEDGAPVSGTLDASDLDTSDDLTFSLVTGPSEGSVSVNADGSYEFDPGADFQDLAVDESRDVAFEYKVVDGHGGESNAVVTITVSGTNDGPVASAGTNDASEDGAPVSGTLDASDLDTSDDLTFSLVTGPSEGSVSVNADGSYEFDPGADFQDLAVDESRDVAFEYKVVDGHGGESNAVVTITVSGTNDGPVASAGTNDASEDGAPVSGTLDASDLDTSDDLTFSLVTGPSEGSVSVNADGSYEFDPGADFQDLAVDESRDVSFEYKVVDGHGGESTAVVTITVSGTNDGPVASAGTNDASEDGAPVSGTLDASDLDTSDDLTFSLVTGPSEGSVSVNADGSYEFDPGADFQDLAVDESRDVAFEYKVVDGHGGESNAVVTITVSGTNDGPVASAGTNDASEDGAPVSGTLDASDLDTSDDLTFSLVTAPSEGSVSVNADGSYEFDPGADFQDLAVDESRDVSFEYKVVDGHGGESTAVVTITVSGTNDGPVATAGTNDASEDGAPVSGTLDASDLDTSDDLTFSLVTGPSEGSVSVNADGSYEFDPGADFQDLAVDESRDVTFEYKVVDGHGGESNAVVTITVSGTNDGPVASAGTNDASEDGAPVSGTLDASDLDTSDDLTFSLVTGPSEGSVSVNADGSYEFDPGADFQDLAVDESRDVAFEYKVVDGHSGESTAVVTITVSGTNDGPVASAGTNDASEDGAPVSGTLDASDLDTSDDLTFSLVTGPSEGSVSVNADGSYEFDPGADFQDLAVDESRDVTFEYKVVDGHGGESTAVVTITVSGTNDGPVASTGTNDASEDGAPVSGTLDASDLDTSDDLTFSLVTGPSEGSVSVNADGSYEFDPGADFQDLAVDESRDVTFEYKVVDGHGGESNAVVTITVSGTNDGPVASAGTNDASEDGALVSGTLDASDLDTSDDLTFSLVTGPSEGSVSVNADGSYEFDPGADFQDLAVDESRDVAFEYKVVDGHGGESNAVVTITVSGTNDGPVASAGTNDASEDGAPVSGTLDASDLDTSDDLTFSLVTGPSEGSVSVNADGSYEFDPGADFQDLAVDESRDVTFEYKVVDGHGGESNAVVTITVSGTNDGPVANPDKTETDEDSTITIDVLANDRDIDATDIVKLVDADITNGLGSVAVVGRQLLYDPGTNYQHLAPGESVDVKIEYSIIDNHGEESTAEVIVTVTGNRDPLVVTLGDATTLEDESVAFPISIERTDTHGEFVRALEISRLPAGSVIFDAVGNLFEATSLIGTVDVNGWDLDSLQIKPALNRADDFLVGIQLTTSNAAGVDQSFTSEIEVIAVADQPILHVDDAQAIQGDAIPLNIHAALTDTDGSEIATIRIHNVPVGTILTDGVNLFTGDGTVADVSTWDLSSLVVIPVHASDADFVLRVEVSATESENGDVATASEDLQIRITSNLIVDSTATPDDAETTYASEPLSEPGETREPSVEDSGVLQSLVNLRPGDMDFVNHAVPIPAPGTLLQVDPEQLSKFIFQQDTLGQHEETEDDIDYDLDDAKRRSMAEEESQAVASKQSRWGALWGLVRAFAGTKETETDERQRDRK